MGRAGPSYAYPRAALFFIPQCNYRLKLRIVSPTMSYLVLARKWRPQNFDEVVGQPHVTKTLQNAIRSNRLAHAYLFTGARGVGKTSVARILAKSINCQGATDSPPCNGCSNCREITQGSSVDVLEIDGASNRGIDSIRELRETVRYRPAKSRYKIYIIDEVHMLTTEAFNALLKTLEEPPDHVLFIFATTEPHKILSTILSRCQRFDFRRIATGEIVKQLKTIAHHEQTDISDNVLYAIAREADGSMRDAQSLLEQLLVFSAEGLKDEEILDVLGVVDRTSVHRTGRAILEGDVSSCLQIVSDLYRRGIDSRRFCQQLCDHFRNLLFWTVSQADASRNVDLPQEELGLLEEQAHKTNSESLYLFFQMLLRGEEEIRRSSMPRIALEMLLVRLARMPQLESVELLLEKLAGLETRLAGGACGELGHASDENHVWEPPPQINDPERAPPPEDVYLSDPGPRPEAAAAVTMMDRFPAKPILTEDALSRWDSFLQWLQANDPVLQAKLFSSRISATSEGLVELEVLDVYADALKDPRSINKLSQLAGSFLGIEPTWVIKGRSSSQLQTGKKSRGGSKRSKTSTRLLVLEHPMVQQALEILGGELIDIKNLKER